MASSEEPSREWKHDSATGEFLISTDIAKFDLDWLNNAFESEDVCWAKALTLEQLSTMLSNSLNLGLYKVLPAVPEAKTDGSPSTPRTPSPTLENDAEEKLQQVGMSRFVTDYITFAYLTDVYIQKDYRDLGLGKTLIKCCQEVMQEIPAMRRGILLTSPDVGKRFYSRELGFYDVNEEREHMICMTRRAYELNDR